MSGYIALIRKEDDSDYGVDFPDFPGGVTAGKDLDDARRLAQELLGYLIEQAVNEEEELPEPSSLETIMTDPDNREAVAVLIDRPALKDRAVRVNITIRESLLNKIDSVSSNRSAFLSRAAEKELNSGR